MRKSPFPLSYRPLGSSKVTEAPSLEEGLTFQSEYAKFSAYSDFTAHNTIAIYADLF